jgi:protein-histidine N-methyltransferase
MLAEKVAFEDVKIAMVKRNLEDVKFQIALEDENLDTQDADREYIQKAIFQHTDVIKGVYEGGLKTWECSLDLVQHLNQTITPELLSKMKVLEVLFEIL